MSQSDSPDFYSQEVQLIASKKLNYAIQKVCRNTQISYQSDLRQFLAWGGSIPCSPCTLEMYLSIQVNNYSISSLSKHLVSIKQAHTALGYQSPTDSELVKATMKGIKRLHGAKQRQVSPILKSNLFEMVEGLIGKKGLRDKALLLIGFAGAFRRSELVGLDYEDLEFVEQGLIVHLNRSKTDQEGKGRKVGIPYARGTLCPVVSLKDWLNESKIDKGPVFRPVTRHGKIESCALSTHAVAVIIKSRATFVGLPADKYSGHSLRAGLVTSAAQAGVSLWKIKQQTGHKSDAMLHRYIRDARIFIDNAAGEIF